MDLDNVREITDKEELEEFMNPINILINTQLMPREDLTQEQKEEIAKELKAWEKEKYGE